MHARRLVSTFYAVTLFVVARGLPAVTPGNVVEQPDVKRQPEGGPVLRTEPVGEPPHGERRMAGDQQDELKVAKVRRISHPGYAAGQCTFGIRDPWNCDRSRLMFNEGAKFTGKQPYMKGSRSPITAGTAVN